MPIVAELRRTDSQEGRASKRYRLCFRGMRGGPNGQDLETSIVDLSATGFLLENTTSLPLDEQILMRLPALGQRSASLVWRSGAYHGGQFAEPLSREELRRLFAESDYIGPSFRLTSSEDRAREPAKSAEEQMPVATISSYSGAGEGLPVQRKAQIIFLAATLLWIAIGYASFSLLG